MRKSYDFSRSIRNPYTKMLKRQITIRLEHDVIDYFKNHAREIGMPYQHLINLYLRDCVSHHRKLNFKWAA